MTPKLQPVPSSAPRLDALARSHGFRVRSENGHLGHVEEVQVSPDTGFPVSIAVRAGRIIVLLVPIEEVEEIRPRERTVVLGPYSTRLVPEISRDRIPPSPLGGEGLLTAG